ncbi:hypothetical protein G7K_4754-t1 [Saitoella complicata NRRL Y-17804]|uniref:Uncharacterized protein n=1 Tax=Saitoella complicata (strain BCRC 22490 / CBS 7301 / JCM 7358 / NBRC 10748 / NRRL Y-17804) TaxID=698492 RepID=A0A0E9NMI0_SAICN|nr:hypothetical protein G7K_4754-t1 [Saitoella complicata NRRL Y-17804]
MMMSSLSRLSSIFVFSTHVIYSTPPLNSSLAYSSVLLLSISLAFSGSSSSFGAARVIMDISPPDMLAVVGTKAIVSSFSTLTPIGVFTPGSGQVVLAACGLQWRALIRRENDQTSLLRRVSKMIN